MHWARTNPQTAWPRHRGENNSALFVGKRARDEQNVRAYYKKRKGQTDEDGVEDNEERKQRERDTQARAGTLTRRGGNGWQDTRVRDCKRPVGILNVIHEEQGHLDAAVLKEASQRLPDGAPSPQAEVAIPFQQQRLAVFNQPLHLGANDNVGQDVEVVEGYLKNVGGLGAGHHLPLEAHGHEVVELVHARLIEPHDGRMRQPVKNLPRRNVGINFLGFEQFVDKLGAKHGANHVLQHWTNREGNR